MFDRKLAIAELIHDDNSPAQIGLYENMSDEQLIAELDGRDISYLFGKND